MLSKQYYDAKLNLDADDRTILSLYKRNAEITQNEISTTINKVQPAVSSRIIKLEQQQLLVTQYGINLEDFRVPLSIARISTRNSRRSLENLAKCDCVLNAFTNIGKFNVTAIMLGNHLQKIETAIEEHFSPTSDVRQLSISPVISSFKQNIFPLDPSLVPNYLIDDTTSMNYVDACLPAIDELDRQILSLLHKNPRITQGKIAGEIGRSQASVSNRVINLHRKGMLAINKGVNFKKTQVILLVQVEISTRNVGAIAKKLSLCSAVPLGYHVQNNASIIAFFAGPSIEQIIVIIDECFQNDEHVLGIETHPIVDYARDLILGYSFDEAGNPEKKCRRCCVPCTQDSLESSITHSSRSNVIDYEHFNIIGKDAGAR